MKNFTQLNQPSWVLIIALVVVAGLAILLLLPSKRVGIERFSSTAPSQRALQTETLYDRIGGKDAIERLVVDALDIIRADTRINKFFANANLFVLKSHLVAQMCEALGGPCKYTGRTMKEAHAGLGISSSDFAYLLEDVLKALDKVNTNEELKKEIIALLEKMKIDIVEKE
jgi:hemoglobin